MKLAAKTWGLAGLAGLLLLLNLLPSSQEAAPLPALPSIAAVAPAAVTRVRISDPISELILEKHGDVWEMVSPLQIEVEPALVQQVLDTFSEGVPMEAAVEEGNLKTYGLEEQYARRVELFTDGAEPVASVLIGQNAAGPSCFVRLPGSDVVYRADVGGRARYDRPAADWRKRAVVGMKPEAVVSIDIEHPAKIPGLPGLEPIHLRREIGGKWRLEGSDIQVGVIDGLVGGLAQLQALAFHDPSMNGGFSPPLATVKLQDQAGRSMSFEVGTRRDGPPDSPGTTFLRVVGQPEVVRVSGVLQRLVVLKPADLADRALFRFTPEQVGALRLEERSLTTLVERGEGRWAVRQPPNTELPQAQLDRLVAGLSQLVLPSAPDRAFAPTGGSLTITLTDGTAQVLRWGLPEGEGEQRQVRVQVEGQAEVFVAPEALLVSIRQLLGRG